MTVQTSINTAVPIPINKGGFGQATQAASSEALISGASLTTATVATDDKILILDTNASDALRTVTAQAIADLSNVAGFVELQKVTVTTDTASVTFTGLNPTSAYAMYIQNAEPVNIISLRARFGSSSGINATANYDYGLQAILSDFPAPIPGDAQNATLFDIGGFAGGLTYSGWFYFNGNADTENNTKTSCFSEIYTQLPDPVDATYFVKMVGLGPSLILDRVQIFFGTGDIASGVFTLYEIVS